MTEVGRTRFQDRMRVSREHLDHLQDVLLGAVAEARESGGLGRVSHGLRVEATSGGDVVIGPGAAVDARGRLLLSPEPVELAPEWGEATRLHVVARHVLRAEGLVKGVPTLLHDDLAFETRAAAPPYEDDAVVFARLERGDPEPRVTQLGEWYLPPLDHGHSGGFVLREGRWRYDGKPLGLPPARFDSGWLGVPAGEAAELVHGLETADLLVHLQARRADGVATTEGLGRDYWHELPDDIHVRLVRAAGEGELRAVAWPLEAGGAGPVLPLADPGPDLAVEPGASFTLDGSRSRAFGGRTLVKYTWTQTS